MKLLMISGDHDLIDGKKGPFYYLLEEFHKYWERIDIICQIKNGSNEVKQYFGNVYVHQIARGIELTRQTALAIYQEAKFDLMVVHDYPPFRHGLAAKKIKQDLKVPYILEIFHIVGYPRAADLKEFLLKIYFKLFIKKITAEALAVRVDNERQLPEALIKLGVAKEKLIHISAFYIDLNVFKPIPQPKEYDIIFAGRLVKNKGLDILIKAIDILKITHPNIKLAIIGRGPEEVKIKEKIKNLNLEQNIKLLGWLVDNQALAVAYNQAKVGIITSYNEGGPRVGLEAMACGLPVVSTKVGVMIDVIKDGQNGYLADWDAKDFADKIKIILDKKDLYSKMSLEATKTIQPYEYRKMIGLYAKTLQSFINKNN